MYGKYSSSGKLNIRMNLFQIGIFERTPQKK